MAVHKLCGGCCLTARTMVAQPMAVAPALYFAGITLGDAITNTVVVDWYESNRKNLAHLPYWLYNVLDQVSVSLGKLTTDMNIVREVVKGNYSKIPKDHFRPVYSIINKAVERLHNAAMGDEEIPQTTVWLNSQAKGKLDMAIRRNHERELHQITASLAPVAAKRIREPAGPKATAPHKNSTQQPEPDRTGDIIWTGGKHNMPIPVYPPGFTLPCGATLRDGKHCTNPACTFSHKRWKDLGSQLQCVWVLHVKKHASSGLSFNRTFVKVVPGCDLTNNILAEAIPRKKRKSRNDA